MRKKERWEVIEIMLCCCGGGKREGGGGLILMLFFSSRIYLGVLGFISCAFKATNSLRVGAGSWDSGWIGGDG